MPSRPKIVVDISAPDLDSIRTEFGSTTSAPRRIFTRNDGNEFDYLFVEQTGNQDAPHRVADLTGYTIQTAIGETDEPSTGGTFDLAYNSNSTGLVNFTFDVSAATLETALNGNTTLTTIGTWTVNTGTEVITTSVTHNLSVGDRIRVTNSGGALPASTPQIVAGTDYFVLATPASNTLTISDTQGGAIINFTGTGTGTHTLHGTVDVEKTSSSYQITYRFSGTKLLLTSVASRLTPDSYASITRVTTGSAGVQEVQWLRLVQKPLGYSNSFVPSVSGSVDVTRLQTGSASLAEVQRIALSVPATSGTFVANITTRQEFTMLCVADVAGSLHQKGFVCADATSTVGIWINEGGGTAPAEVLAAARQIAITTITSGMSAANVATQMKLGIDADAQFVATVSGNVVTVRQASGGARTVPLNAAATTGFTFTETAAGSLKAGVVPVGASAETVARAIQGVVSVTVSGVNQWDITFPTLGTQDLITVAAEPLFQTVYKASLDLANNQTFSRFASEAATTEFITVPWEISITPSGGQPITIYRQDHDVYRDVITNDVTASNPLPTSITSIPVGKSIFVDSIYGSDSGSNIGLVERADRPFLTLAGAAAASASLSESCIFVRQGSYSAATSIAGGTQTWIFEGSTTVTWTASSGALFNDGGTQVNLTVKGGTFVVNEGTSSGSPLVICSHSSSEIIFETEKVSGNAANQFFQQSAGTLTLRVKNTLEASNGPSFLSFSGGTCVIDGGYHNTGDADATVRISGTTAGTIEFRNSPKIKNTNSGGFPIEIAISTTNKTIIFDGGRYISHASASNAIAAGDAQTIKVVSPISTNTGIDSFITVSPNAGHTEDTCITE